MYGVAALREAAKAYKRELQFRNPASLKNVKRRREFVDQADQARSKRPNKVGYTVDGFWIKKLKGRSN